MTGAMWALPLIAFGAAWLLTRWLLGYAVRRRMMDVPGERSSHQVATPRGGGASIVVVATLAFAGLALWGSVTGLPMALLAGGLVVAAVGFIDDHGHLAPAVRLAGHFAGAILAVWALGGAPALSIFGTLIDLGWTGHVLAVLFVVWMLNLTNFMDGIDGIAATQVLTVCIVGAWLHVLVLPGDGGWLEPLLLASCTAGFLFWNWPPARIFMGDVGSGYLGFMIAVLTLRAAWLSPVLGWCWLILSAVFIVDATTTLVRRAIRGARLSQAHRGHAYQQLARSWQSHRRVTLLVAGINLVGLAPVAWLVATGRVPGEAAFLVASAPLVAGATWLGAGRS